MFALMLRVKIFVTLLIFSSFWSKAQNTFLPIDNFTNYYTDRLDIIGISHINSTSLKPLLRNEVYNFDIKEKNKNSIKYYGNIIAPQSFRYIEADNIELSDYDTSDEKSAYNFKTFKKQIFAHPSAFYSVHKKDFLLVLNPVFGFSGGYDFTSNNSTFQNSRGLEVRGTIDNKVGFYSFITENQFRFPQYYNTIIDSSGVIPGYGFHKPFGSGAYDFFLARGYITFSATKHISMQFGHDRNFIGNGYRSLILSDFSNPYLFLKINTKFRRFNYQNLYTQLYDYSYSEGKSALGHSKYFVNHYLGIKFPCNFSIGFFESVIYNRGNNSSKGYFDISYLNPVIFYRAIEHNLNSSDNVMVGADWKWNFKNHFSFYGQFVLDEFIKNEMVKHTRSWVNKFGVQSGLKYINAFKIKYLDVQIEYNIVRPYMYAHFKQNQNYINYNQPLAHPFGANFKEIVFLAKYRPTYKLFVEAGFLNIIKGLDSNSTTKNFGGNILIDYQNRPKDTGIKISDGVKTVYSIFFANASCMVYHNLWFDAKLMFRKVESKSDVFNNKCTWLQVGFRMNLSQSNNNF